MTDVKGTLGGVGFQLDCDLPELAAYASRHMEPLCGASAPTRVSARLRWHEGQPPSREVRREAGLASMQRVDRDLYTAGDELRWFRVDDLRDLFLRIRVTDQGVEVEGDFFYRLGNSRSSDAIRRVRQWRNLGVMRQRRFPTLLAYLVFYPCWWWAETTRGVHPIHAAGVEMADGVILLAGASGVGKSTLSVALSAEEGSHLLADSFVLHRGADVEAVPEPILLDRWSRDWLGERLRFFHAMGASFGLGRQGFHAVPERRSAGGRAVGLVFPRRSPAPFLRAVESITAHRWLSAGNLMINDLRRYFAFAAVLEHLRPSGLMAAREHELARLTAEVPSVEIGLTRDMSCGESVAEVCQWLAGLRRP